MTTMVAMYRKLRAVRKNCMYFITEAKQLVLGRHALPFLIPNERTGVKLRSSNSRKALSILLFIAVPVLFLFTTFLTASSHNNVTRRSSWSVAFPARGYIPLLHANNANAERSGVSIVAACKNRHEALQSVISSWEGAIGFDEIIIIDWDSSPPLSETITPGGKVHIVRVENEKRWVLTRAYNLGISLAHHEWILRLDCDFRLAPSFLQAHTTTAQTFWSGHWQSARSEEELHLNGALLVRRSDFLHANGYDERIQTYGWDDEDLFSRLISIGLKRRGIDYDQLQHVSHRHDNLSRVNIDYNALLLQRVPKWNGTSTPQMRNGTTLLARSRYLNGRELRAAERPTELAQLVDADGRERDWRLALGRRLHDEYGLCWDLMSRMDGATRERLLRRLEGRTKRRGGILVVHVMHGLGNRLRALASGMAFAEATDRVLVVVWESDAHCGARFEELFENEMVVVDGLGLMWPFDHAEDYDAAWSEWDLYNYMTQEGGSAKKGEVVKNGERNIYFKGAYIMESVYTRWKACNERIQRLVAVGEIRDAVQTVEERLRGSIGVHVRHTDVRNDIADINALREYGDFESRILAFWRSVSHPDAFVKAIEGVRSESGAREVFVCADSEQWRREIARKVEGVWWMNGTCTGRNVECMKQATVDLLALTRTRLVIGSMWSSFSEAVARLGVRDLRLVGVDFNETDVDRRFGDDVAQNVAQIRYKRRARRIKH